MGGTNEKAIETKVAKGNQPNSKEIAVAGGKGRMHEDVGETHLHDDTNKIKVSVPSYIFEGRVKDWLAAPAEKLIFFDTKNNTTATLSITPDFNVEYLFAKVTIGDNLKKLIEFSEAR